MDNDRDRRAAQEPANVAPRLENDGFDRLLRAALRSEDPAAGSECLDAGALAAWCDGALTPSERSFADAHVARCGRCQSLLAVMARTAPAAAAAAPTWSLRQWLMMLAPAAAATTAVALWFAVEPRQSPLETPVQQVASRAAQEQPPATSAQPEAAPATAPATAPPPTPSAAPVSAGPASTDQFRKLDEAKAPSRTTVAPVPFGGLGSDAGRERQMAATRDALEEEKRKLADAAAKSVTEVTVTASSPTIQTSTAQVNSNAAPRENNVNAPGTVAGYTGNVNAAAGVGDRRAEKPASTVPPPPPAAPVAAAAPSARAQATPPQAPPAPAPRTDQQQADLSQRAPLQSAGGSAGRGGGVPQDLQRAQSNESVALSVRFVVASQDASVQWRVVSDGIVQQSIDKGATWATQYSVEGKGAIAAGSAPAPTVAWLVGRAGLVLATTDGRTWRRIDFPVAVDLTAVAAIDARTAIVTATDRRIFSTSDGGRTWIAK
jgi:hypothetical protein